MKRLWAALHPAQRHWLAFWLTIMVVAWVVQTAIQGGVT